MGIRNSMSFFLRTIVGFLVMPLFWSIPEAVITAELSTMMPHDGGFVLWVERAYGPVAGFMEGWLKWVSGVVDNALYPVLVVQVCFSNYLLYLGFFGGGGRVVFG